MQNKLRPLGKLFFRLKEKICRNKLPETLAWSSSSAFPCLRPSAACGSSSLRADRPSSLFHRDCEWVLSAGARQAPTAHWLDPPRAARLAVRVLSPATTRHHRNRVILSTTKARVRFTRAGDNRHARRIAGTMRPWPPGFLNLKFSYYNI